MSTKKAPRPMFLDNLNEADRHELVRYLADHDKEFIDNFDSSRGYVVEPLLNRLLHIGSRYE